MPDSLPVRPVTMPRAMLPQDPAAVAVAVVIPAWNQPGLLPEAIEAVLGQQDAPPLAAVVVDDGCPSPSTAAVALHYAAACPGRVFLLRQRNRGLSAARNTGIDFALAAFPNCRALFFLDADNRLRPHFLARAWAALQAAPVATGWFYPDIDEFGAEQNNACGGDFSLLHLIVQNYCEAGSLVRREVLERGLRFDTTAMRAGFEDWDFWLQCARAGFRGQHLPEAGFLYRRRPESMLAAAERQRDHLLRQLRERHAPLLTPRALAALEAAEAPRIALFEAERPGALLFLDPDRAAEVAAPELRRRLLAAARAPGAVHAPALCLFAEGEALDLLRGQRLLPMLLWWAERLLREHELVALEIVPGEAGLELELRHGPSAPVARSALLLLTGERLVRLAEDPLSPEVVSLDGEVPLPALARLRLTLPGPLPAPGSGALRRLQAEIAALGRLHLATARMPGPWRTDWRGARRGMAMAARAAIGLGTTLPLLPEPGRREIGFLLPLFAFAGLEKVVMRQARVLRGRGWRTHLVVAGALSMDWGPEVTESFDTVTLFQGLGEDRLEFDTGYFGGVTSRMDRDPAAADALGLLALCDVVVNTHAVGCHALMAPLRRLGVKAFGALHLVERTAWGEPNGNPQTLAAYEHAYDGVLVISEALRRWCIGQGLPRDKLCLVRNAPGYAADPDRVAAALRDRAERTGPLRVLFLGRLDAQKGIDRLAAILAATDMPEVAWRVVGREVLADGARPLLGVPVAPPVQAPEELDALYAWADLLVLPSRFEGVPLVILEAQRMGCAVAATDVGAVREIVTEGEDGVLVPADLPEEAIIQRFVEAIQRLAADRAALRALGARAAARAGALTWEDSMREFLDRLEALVPAPGPAPVLAPVPAAVPMIADAAMRGSARVAP
ncbi:glycosyltransferase [Paracraurococcus lichenis]|uniref:Glycosyltransferase n=1 Tax=Paracraurococcus lichenis TaxID=3064888 RepID=A0ABT9E4R0_9PROT|nr:glycosyltransferase [Paracraurococcus sp. LOR1-02]MDO9711065.1 glycosyltransferase [Paracraurococcus sp. LOR1-02]